MSGNIARKQETQEEILRRKILTIAGALGLFVLGLVIGIASGGTKANPAASPRPTVTVTATETGPVQTETVTASPPAPGPGTTLITRSSANENWNSKPFNIGSGPVTVKYSYSSCPDGSGNYIIDLKATDGNDDISVSNIIGSGGSYTSQEYPSESGSEYYLAVQTECTYSVTVESSGLCAGGSGISASYYGGSRYSPRSS